MVSPDLGSFLSSAIDPDPIGGLSNVDRGKRENEKLAARSACDRLDSSLFTLVYQSDSGQ